MKEFIINNWAEILSVVGASAWLPIIFSTIFNCLRRISATVLDFRILTNGKGVSVGKREKKNGTILIFVANFFIRKVPFFARKLSVKVRLKNGGKLNSEILDLSTITSNNDDGSVSGFSVPDEKEFNISRTIHADTDNIKYVAVLVESANFSKIHEIEEIEIRMYYYNKKIKLLSKKVLLKIDDFPTFNSANLISVVEHFNK